MAELAEKLVLEHLNRIQVELADARERDREIITRLSNIEVSLAGLRTRVPYPA